MGFYFYVPMDYTDVYLLKHGFRPQIAEEPHPRLNLCIVIPCYNEFDLLISLQSIWNCTRPQMAVEVIVVVNSAENCASGILERNKITLQEASLWVNNHFDQTLRFRIIHRPDLPAKFAGVGLARKIGMDEAAYRLNLVNNKEGIIAGFDADAVCAPNYLVEVENHFKVNKKTPGASIYYEHPMSGITFDDTIYAGVCLYELHLRYINQALRYAKHPHSYHTVGSSFVVRMDAYVKQGGMNKRQAGEDFYFLQKIIALGNFSEINTTLIVPSPRESDRVPFGTGASMKRWKTEGVLKTYHLKAFDDIKALIGLVDQFFESAPENVPVILATLSIAMRDYLRMNDFENELKSIVANSASLNTFRDRFFRWFNAFRMVKFLNFSHEKQYEKSEIVEEAKTLAKRIEAQTNGNEVKELLELYRKLDKSGFGIISQ